MTVTETIKSAVGLSTSPPLATREEMRDAKLPIQYRDSCANLLIPLNRCRYEEYYLPWKCEVSLSLLGLGRYGWALGRAGGSHWGVCEGREGRALRNLGMGGVGREGIRVPGLKKRRGRRQLTFLFLQTERHSYEKCQYDEFKKRVAKMDELRAAKGGERSN
ncbi:hypothetical protein VTL71DRAFT_12300 [Oculimacula yallundae]|uniref:NADH dehydrogenase [ubiquinone] 1 beta subcomplex subunit 7 n=1 Tax=Oculimacula yallundae TaxID=86028 RepID=A0ABR4CML3_9HELO